jgi:uncharacterized protein YerC
MRTSQQKLNPALQKQIEMMLVRLLQDIKNEKELSLFLTDFLNPTELVSFSKRLAIAYWLQKGRSYENIRQNLKVSSATIATVQATLKKPGIKLALKKIEAEEWASQWTKRIQKVLK